MKYFFFTFGLIIVFCGKVFSADSTGYSPSLKTLKQNTIQNILSTPVNTDEVVKLMDDIKADGSWSDIDYADKTRGGWPVNNHLVRLNNMAIVFTLPNTKWTGNPELAQKIVSGINYWIKNDFICPNWWYPQIGVPKTLGPTMILMEKKLTKAQIDAGIRILDRAKIGMTGQNKVWLSGNVIYRSLLNGDVKQIDTAVKSIQEEIVVSEGEGIQADNSYHQHGTQQQFGNYGLSYASDMLKWATMFQHTPFQFSANKIIILRNYLMDGMRWIIWKNKMDISACGRQLFPGSQISKAQDVKDVFAKMPLIDAAFASQYVMGLGGFEGDKHFWKSDMTVHRRKDFYTSVKMSSERVGGAESCNDENVQGYHLGDGATYFYQSGEEYTDIFPYWDWKKIPGTTAFYDSVPLPLLPCSGYNINSSFVGGVSNGTNGIATLAYKRDGLVAQKAWFFFDDAVICLGTGIHTDKSKLVTTTVNQSFLHGDIIIKQASTTKTLTEGQHALKNINWAIHDNWGYYFPGNTDVELSNQLQIGNWNNVAKRLASKETTAGIFTLSLSHSVKPDSAHYGYYVFPHAAASNIELRALALSIVANTPQLQVVENVAKGLAGFVFVKAGEAITNSVDVIAVDQPCIVLVQKKDDFTDLFLADPTHLLTKIVIGVKGKKKSATYAGKFDAAKNMTYFTLKLPDGMEAGKSINFRVEKD